MKNKVSDIFFIDKKVLPIPLIKRILSHMNIINHIKIIIRLTIRLFSSGDQINFKEYKGKIDIAGKEGICTLITYEDYKDFQIQSSKQALIYSNISELEPALVLTKMNFQKKTIKFSVFLNCEIKNAKNILINGFIQDKVKEHFSINVNDKIIFNLSKPAYWIEISINTDDFKLDVNSELIKIYLTKVIINRKDSDVKKLKFCIISDERLITNESKKLRPVFILSFDGITTEDIICNETYTDTNKFITEFAEANYWFKNAITSSTVTASSAACLVSGQTLSMHNMYIYSKKYLSPSLKTISSNTKILGEKIRDIGMKSYGFFSFGKWSPQYGYSRGFNDYRCISGRYKERYPWFEEFLKITMIDLNSPYLFAMHHPGGHAPFFPNLSASCSDLEFFAYKKNLSFVNNFFNSILNELKSKSIYDDSLIIILSDHGRSLSEYSRKGFQFQEKRLRVPLVVKNPDWDFKSNRKYDINKHISTQTTVHEIVCDFLGIEENCSEVSKNRNVGGVTWVCETIDYSREDYIGIVGYDNNFKYTIYYNVDFQSYTIGDYQELLRYPLSICGIAEDISHHIDERNERKRIIDSAYEFLHSGLEYSKDNPPEEFGARTKMFS